MEDEVLLTELALDKYDPILYDISSLIFVGEMQSKLPLYQFKAFYDKEHFNFFIEMRTESGIIPKTMLLQILDIAENLKAEKVYVCLRRDDKNLSKNY